jgi:YHS domain-containing protein
MKDVKIVAAILLALNVVLILGCGCALQAVEKKEPLIGNPFICPVSGEIKTITPETPTFVHNGRTYYFCCPHCVKKFRKDPTKYIKEEKESAIVANKLLCPVMNTEFIPTDKSPKVEYEGKTYYFCCPDCVEKFNKEPQKYLAELAELTKGKEHENHKEETTKGEKGVKYVCDSCGKVQLHPFKCCGKEARKVVEEEENTTKEKEGHTPKIEGGGRVRGGTE